MQNKKKKMKRRRNILNNPTHLNPIFSFQGQVIQAKDWLIQKLDLKDDDT